MSVPDREVVRGWILHGLKGCLDMLERCLVEGLPFSASETHLLREELKRLQRLISISDHLRGD